MRSYGQRTLFRIHARTAVLSASRTRLGTIALVAASALVLTACGDQDVSTGEAEKAAQLQALVAPLGVELSTGIAASLFGTDGGHLCGAAGSSADLGHVALAPEGFALRKTESDADDVAFARAVIEVYCPDKLASFDAHVADLDVDGD